MISIKNIKKDYVMGDSVVHALKDVNINFRDNEFVSILGPSGCGKTTLLNIIGGLDKYTDGDIIIDGVSTKKYKARDWDTYRNHYIGFVFQSYNLISHLSILENVELALSIAGLPKKEKRKKAIKALTQVGLLDQLKKKPNQLSGGQMQRVAIARAIVNEPKIILADEPTGALDSETSVQIMDILKEISKNCLVVMVTHNSELANKYSNRIIKILDGEITEDSQPYNIEEPQIENSEKIETNKPKTRKKHSQMTIFTAFLLSCKNLIAKKWKTLLISFAGSIGIIGIALVLAVSNGLNVYVANMQTETLSGYPITVGTVAIDYNSVTNAFSSSSSENTNNVNKDEETSVYNVTDMLLKFGNFNYLNQEFKDYINAFYTADCDKPRQDRDLTALQYQYDLQLKALTNYNGTIKHLNTESATSSIYGTTSNSVFFEAINNLEYIEENYDLLGGNLAHFPSSKNEIALVIDGSNSVSVQNLASYGIYIDPTSKKIELSSLIGKEYKLILNDDYYTYDSVNDIFTHPNLDDDATDLTTIYNNSNNVTLTISCVLRLKENASGSILNNGLMYTEELTNYLKTNARASEIATKTLALNLTDNFYVPFDLEIAELQSFVPAGAGATLFYYTTPAAMLAVTNGETFNLNMGLADSLEMALQKVGASNVPTSVQFYSSSFKAKENIENYLNAWNNETHAVNNKIVYSDATEFLTSTLGKLIDIVSYVLIAFASISLVVSSIMIGIITYTSVIERTKEIGVLRSIGARKKDVTRLFNAETLMIGFGSGLIGVVISFLLTFPISAIIKNVAGGAITTSMAILTLPNAIILVAISTILTLISGLIPAFMASKKDPVKALRTE